MNIDDLSSLFTNVGFPIAICFILLRYMLQTMGNKLDKLDNSLNRLTKVIRELDAKHKVRNEEFVGDSPKEKKTTNSS
ncbi:hypothetical protein ACFSQ7_02240 [Paenibacillus rhizoplanae]